MTQIFPFVSGIDLGVIDYDKKLGFIDMRLGLRLGEGFVGGGGSTDHDKIRRLASSGEGRDIRSGVLGLKDKVERWMLTG